MTDTTQPPDGGITRDRLFEQVRRDCAAYDAMARETQALINADLDCQAAHQQALRDSGHYDAEAL